MKKSPFVTGLLLLICLISVNTVSAYTRNIVLPFSDSEIAATHREPKAVYLKKELRNHYPYLDISSLELKQILLLAKSRTGNSTVQLRVGREVTTPALIRGTPYTFHNRGKRSFDRIQLDNPAYRSTGPWQLLFHGKTVLRKVVLVVEDRNDDHAYTFPPDRQSADGWKYSDNDRDRRQNYKDRWGNGKFSHQSSSVVLPIKSWGTDLESERRCNEKSHNVRDGWDYPDSICANRPKATYRSGYRPAKLFIRPDIAQLEHTSTQNRISGLQIDFGATENSRTGSGKNISATLGIDIDGQTYTTQISPNNRQAAKGRGITESLEIFGNWTTRDLARSTIWIMPNRNSSDFTIQSLRIQATRKH